MRNFEGSYLRKKEMVDNYALCITTDCTVWVWDSYPRVEGFVTTRDRGIAMSADVQIGLPENFLLLMLCFVELKTVSFDTSPRGTKRRPIRRWVDFGYCLGQ